MYHKKKLSEQNDFWKSRIDSYEAQQLKAAGFSNTEELLSLPVVCLENLKTLGGTYTVDIISALYDFYNSDEDVIYKDMLIVRDYCDGEDFVLSLQISIDELLHKMKNSNYEFITRMTVREIVNIGYLDYDGIEVLVSEILRNYKKVYEHPGEKFENKSGIKLSGNDMFKCKRTQEGEYR